MPGGVREGGREASPTRYWIVQLDIWMVTCFFHLDHLQQPWQYLNSTNPLPRRSHHVQPRIQC